MSRADLERLSTDLDNDPGLGAEFARLGGDAASWVRQAESKGYHLTSEEAVSLSSSFDEMSDDDLDHVAGGWTGDDGSGGG